MSLYSRNKKGPQVGVMQYSYMTFNEIKGAMNIMYKDEGISFTEREIRNLYSNAIAKIRRFLKRNNTFAEGLVETLVESNGKCGYDTIDGRNHLIIKMYDN